MNLVIVESPSKAKTIAKYLGSGYRVIASGGHVRDLPAKKLAVNVHRHFEPEYQVNPDKLKTVNTLKKEVANAEKVYLATDPDREGEAISWHLKEVLGLKEENRIVFNEITKKAVNGSLEKSRAIDMDLVNSQQARRVLDRLVGYLISPVISRKIQSGLSAGRVQSVALKMIVEREKEIRSFVPEEYYNIFAELKSLNASTVFKTQFNDINGKKTKVTNKEQSDEIVNGSKNGKWSVDSVKRAKSLSKPNPPFTTSTLQQDAVNKLNMSGADIMRIAQQLYEGVQIDGEHQALVTYIRTDSVRVSDDAQTAARQFITDNYGSAYCPKKPNIYGTSANAQDAHEAIRPVSIDIRPDSLKGKIDNKQYRLYKLIYDRFLASQMSNAEYDTLTVHIISDNGDKYGYTLKGKTMTFAGFKAVYTSSTEEEDKDTTLPQLEENQPLNLEKITSEQKFTKPPLRFTDSSIVKAMEDNGIGRPSTYASIISLLYKREYTVKDGKYIVPTQLGELLCGQLVKYFPNIMDTQFTAEMEHKLDTVADGNVDWHEILDKFYPPFVESLEKAGDGERVRLDPIETEFKCEKCGKPLLIKTSRYGKFLGCSGYPECNYMRSYEEYEQAVKNGTDIAPLPHCNKCGKEMVLKGKFYGCTGYPDCKNTVNIAKNGSLVSAKESNMPAPICDKCGSTMVLKSKGNSYFYACPKYPTCKNIKPYEEIDGKCPECGADLIKSYGKGGRNTYRCSNDNCSYKSGGKGNGEVCPKCKSTMSKVDLDGKTVYECQNPTCGYIEDGNGDN